MKKWSFPAGERGVVVPYVETSVDLQLTSPDPEAIMDMLLAVNAYRHANPRVSINLYIPYLPYGRQDRVTEAGGCHGLQVFAQLLNMCDFNSIHTLDMHSDVLEGLLKPGILHNILQHNIWEFKVNQLKAENADCVLVAPDAGASKKIYKLSRLTGIPMIEARKVRDLETGAITATEVTGVLSQDITYIVVDDICDGGATFIELAKVLPSTAKKILCVTHGIFSKGREVLERHYNEVYTYNDMRK